MLRAIRTINPGRVKTLQLNFSLATSSEFVQHSCGLLRLLLFHSASKVAASRFLEIHGLEESTRGLGDVGSLGIGLEGTSTKQRLWGALDVKPQLRSLVRTLFEDRRGRPTERELRQRSDRSKELQASASNLTGPCPNWMHRAWRAQGSLEASTASESRSQTRCDWSLSVPRAAAFAISSLTSEP